ncbi:hypothetical protein AXG93_1864s1350 [Marchantia polymorpha subsp. ruderalis]|nr:hypothetical protein AXG93_1864s1350 [Marchantia polymorpha subsp. ruderalis]
MVMTVQALGPSSLGTCGRRESGNCVVKAALAQRKALCHGYCTRYKSYHAVKNVTERRLASTATHVVVKCASSVSSAVPDTAQSREELALIEALLGIQGRGRVAAPQQLEAVQRAIDALEEAGGVQDPTLSPLIEGRWQLMFTTRPGTASPIQRTFVGVDAFTVFQEIELTGTTDPRVSNIVRASESIGELKVEAAATRESNKRILFRFDKAAFDFKFLPFKVPYPVPFKLLGDEAKGWLDTTYLSPSGTIRISRGNKGSTFILQKNLDPRQQLLQAVATGTNVEKAIEVLVSLNPTKDCTDIGGLKGQWRLLWNSQAENANWIQKSSVKLKNWQIYYDNTRLENLVEFLPGLKLRAGASTLAASEERQDVKIEGASLELGSLRIPVNITGEGYVDILYLDQKLKISRGNKGSMFLHVREE